MNPLDSHRDVLSRREFLGRTSLGLGTAALATLLHRDQAFAGGSGGDGILEGVTHLAPRAKRVRLDYPMKLDNVHCCELFNIFLGTFLIHIP